MSDIDVHTIGKNDVTVRELLTKEEEFVKVHFQVNKGEFDLHTRETKNSITSLKYHLEDLLRDLNRNKIVLTDSMIDKVYTFSGEIQDMRSSLLKNGVPK